MTTLGRSDNPLDEGTQKSGSLKRMMNMMMQGTVNKNASGHALSQAIRGLSMIEDDSNSEEDFQRMNPAGIRKGARYDRHHKGTLEEIESDYQEQYNDMVQESIRPDSPDFNR